MGLVATPRWRSAGEQLGRRASPEDIRRASERLIVAIRTRIFPSRFRGSCAAKHVSGAALVSYVPLARSGAGLGLVAEHLQRTGRQQSSIFITHQLGDDWVQSQHAFGPGSTHSSGCLQPRPARAAAVAAAHRWRQRSIIAAPPHAHESRTVLQRAARIDGRRRRRDAGEGAQLVVVGCCFPATRAAQR